MVGSRKYRQIYNRSKYISRGEDEETIKGKDKYRKIIEELELEENIIRQGKECEITEEERKIKTERMEANRKKQNEKRGPKLPFSKKKYCHG